MFHHIKKNARQEKAKTYTVSHIGFNPYQFTCVPIFFLPNNIFVIEFCSLIEIYWCAIFSECFTYTSTRHAHAHLTSLLLTKLELLVFDFISFYFSLSYIFFLVSCIFFLKKREKTLNLWPNTCIMERKLYKNVSKMVSACIYGILFFFFSIKLFFFFTHIATKMEIWTPHAFWFALVRKTIFFFVMYVVVAPFWQRMRKKRRDMSVNQANI